MSRRARTVRGIHGITLLASGLLAGAFGYGAANLVPTFNAVPQDMRFSFHAELMKINGITVQGAMIVTTLGSLTLAVLTRGRARVAAAAASALAFTSFLITRFGNVPINAHIKRWAVSGPDPDTPELLRRWELFNDARTAVGIAAFGVLIMIALRTRTYGLPDDQARP
ncbi:anthrone oxygenase family protein [Streptomyces sp. NPDC101160]|uniref:anthrone oxygenase family protein n=1 Tax=Streptomyces sp. NPDC101160 TaxID=3366118 RepID=UPI003830E739